MNEESFDRRRFIKVSTTTVASLLVGCPEKSTVKRATSDVADTNSASQRDGRRDPTSEGELRPAATQGGGQEGQLSDCAVTSRDITGPYWRKGIPVRNQFDVYGHSGQALTLSGVVRDKSCRPIPDAVIEMWHANPTSIQAHALSARDSVDYDMASPAFRYYGQFATDQRGEYSMSTKKPGWYLNGDAFRPSHIHVKVYVKGVERLTTQLYFEGDPFIRQDPWASVAPERVLALKSNRNGHLSSRFDFTLSTVS